MKSDPRVVVTNAPITRPDASEAHPTQVHSTSYEKYDSVTLVVKELLLVKMMKQIQIVQYMR